MKMNAGQFDALERNTREARENSRDAKAAVKAIEAQQVAILELLGELVGKVDDTNKRITFSRQNP